MCLLGNRLLHATNDSICSKTVFDPVEETTVPTDLWKIYCSGEFNASDPYANCDKYFKVGFPESNKQHKKWTFDVLLNLHYSG